MFSFLKDRFQKCKKALFKTRLALKEKFNSLLGKKVDEDLYLEIEKTLFEADLGSKLASEFADLTREALLQPGITTEELFLVLKKRAQEIFAQPAKAIKTSPQAPLPKVVLVVGVNGSGKTTTIAKLCHLAQEKGQSVLLGAADTFRAAAVEQLTLWASKLHADIVKGVSGADPSAVAFDAAKAAIARQKDLVLIDTAGRLQNKEDLMQELSKVRRVLDKALPGAPHETLLILDASTGQNALDQARAFHHIAPLSGIILTKLDGSAKGGIALAIYEELSIPILYIGTGENFSDLIEFESSEYINSLFSTE